MWIQVVCTNAHGTLRLISYSLTLKITAWLDCALLLCVILFLNFTCKLTAQQDSPVAAKCLFSFSAPQLMCGFPLPAVVLAEGQSQHTPLV